MGKTYAFVGNDFFGAYVADRLVSAGYGRSSDVGSADVVLTYCTMGADLEDAYFEENGIIKLAAKKTLLIDLSPSFPAFARELNAIATVSDMRAVEAPLYALDLTQTDLFATKDAFGCFVAGEQADVAEARPILDLLAAQVTEAEGCGAAQLAKATRTIQDACAFVSAIEAEALCRVVREVSNSVDGPSVVPEPVSDRVDAALKAVAEERFDGDFTVEMLLGDVMAAMTAADDVDLILPQLESVMHLLEVLFVIGGADRAPAALSLLYRNEEESARHGLDWTRAETMYETFDANHEHAHDHGHDHGDDYYDDDDYYYEDDYDDLGGYAGGFGGYSSN